MKSLSFAKFGIPHSFIRQLDLEIVLDRPAFGPEKAH